MKHLAQRKQVEAFVTQPIAQHISLISTYVNAWRDYLVHHEEELLTLVLCLSKFNRLFDLLIIPSHRQCQSWGTNP